MVDPEIPFDDPFAAFDDEEESDRDDDDHSMEATTVRDPSCGVLVFRQGTERALLAYVQNGLTSIPSSFSPTQRLTWVLQRIDDFCLSRHWMMHIGPKKGPLLRDFLLTRHEEYQANRKSSNDRFRIVEVGTYCGYSTILLAHAILDHDPAGRFQIVTVDVDPFHQEVAQTMVQIAGLAKVVDFVCLRLNQRHALSAAVQSHLKSAAADFVFLDHDKDLYLSDLIELERSRVIRKGTAVAADNVVFAAIDQYRDYVASRVDSGVVRTEMIFSQLEYVLPVMKMTEEGTAEEDFIDGIELTVYLQDPPVL